MAKDERKHMVHPLTYDEIPLPDGRVLVLKERLEVPLERRHDRGIVWFASNDELGIRAQSPDQKTVERDIAEQIGTLYMAGVESATPKAGKAKEQAQKLKDLVREVRAGTGHGQRYL
jgi:hypothetical protein